MTVEIHTSAVTTGIGQWQLAARVYRRGRRGSLIKVTDDIIILFNPWHKSEILFYPFIRPTIELTYFCPFVRPTNEWKFLKCSVRQKSLLLQCKAYIIILSYRQRHGLAALR